MNRLICIILIVLMGFGSSKATHIVGGDFYYEYLGGDNYRITMKLYLDCENGNPDAIAGDLYADFGIFDAKGRLLDEVSVRRQPGVKLMGSVYKCVVDPGNVCVERYNYVFDVKLPKYKGGYTISFQRCCRNKIIDNIILPESTGATYWVQIPDRDEVPVDNSPIFKKFPPIYICKDFPLVFDHSASDQDGDSLSYELYRPFVGADKNAPKPSPPSSPPYSAVQWTSSYGTNNQMGGNPILTIDAKTGELTVTPSILGEFVIGVKVIEWRNGQKIGETFRDYQFSVIKCEAIAVANFEKKKNCGDTVWFQNKCIGTTTISWDFGDPGSGIANNTSLEPNPFHVYSTNGDFYPTIKAWNPACQDEYKAVVKIRTQSAVNLGSDKIHCKPIKELMSVAFIDYSKILWSTGSDQPFIQVSQPGKYWVRTSYGECIFSDTINLGFDPISYLPIPDSLFCDKVDAFLELKGRSPGAKIIWAIGDTAAKIHAIVEGKYAFKVYNTNCLIRDTVDLVLARIQPVLGPDLFICNDFVRTLDAGKLQAGTTLQWSDGSTNSTMDVDKAGTYWVISRLQHCSETDTMVIENSKVTLDLGPNRHYCDSFNCVLDAGPANHGSSSTYLWNNGETTQQITTNIAGQYWVLKRDNFGCENADSLFIGVSLSPIVSIGEDTVVICRRSPIVLSPESGFEKYLWENGSEIQIREVELSGKYHVTVTDQMGCTGSDTIIVVTDPNKLPNHIFIPNAFTPNGDGLNDVFPFDDPVLQPNYHLRIFNRWGEKVYDTDTSREPWDGQTRNDDGQLDAYIWIATYRGCDGDPKYDKGTVTIVR